MAKKNNRNYIGIEKDETYYNIANERIKGVALHG
jgi:DNA modification methylase